MVSPALSYHSNIASNATMSSTRKKQHQDDYQRQVEQVEEARRLNRELDENTKLTKQALYVAIFAAIIETLQLLLQ